MWPFLNNVTTTCEQNYCTPASSICYTGYNLSCIGVNQNDTLSVALQKINAVMCEPISSAKIIEALGYIPANDANVLHTTGDETKNGRLTVNDTAVGFGFGVKGTSINGNGVQGESTNLTGVLGISTNFTGVLGVSTGGVGVNGASTDFIGVLGISTDYMGVLGESENSYGVQGNSTTGIGVYGYSETGLAGYFDTNIGTKIVSFATAGIEQAYILASGLFKANKILVNTDIDNGIDALQVNGTISATEATTANQVIIKSQLDAVRPYKVYTALLTQTGTNAPTAIVLENTIGTTISYSYTSSGTYKFIATGNPFTLNKTAVFISGQLLGLGFGTVTTAFVTTSNQGIIGTQQSSGGVNDYLINTPIEIRVYN